MNLEDESDLKAISPEELKKIAPVEEKVDFSCISLDEYIINRSSVDKKNTKIWKEFHNECCCCCCCEKEGASNDFGFDRFDVNLVRFFPSYGLVWFYSDFEWEVTGANGIHVWLQVKSTNQGSRIAPQWINWTTFLANLDSSGVERWQLLGPSGHEYSFRGVALDDQGRRRYSRVISLGIIP